MKTKKINHIHCPANGWDCPYYTDEDHPCRCTLPHPEEDCSDFGYYWEEDEDWIDDDWEVPDEPMYLDLYSPYGAGDKVTYEEALERVGEVISISDMWEQLDYLLYSTKEWTPANLIKYLPEELRMELFNSAVKERFDGWFTEIKDEERMDIE